MLEHPVLSQVLKFNFKSSSLQANILPAEHSPHYILSHHYSTMSCRKLRFGCLRTGCPSNANVYSLLDLPLIIGGHIQEENKNTELIQSNKNTGENQWKVAGESPSHCNETGQESEYTHSS